MDDDLDSEPSSSDSGMLADGMIKNFGAVL